MTTNGYCTSSKIIKNIIKDTGLDSFIVNRIKIFQTGQEAYNYETKFLVKVNAKYNKIFYNLSNNIGNFIPSERRSTPIPDIDYDNATNDTLKVLCNIIRNTRLSRGYSQESMANSIGISRATYQKIELYSEGIRFFDIIKCCQILKVPIFDINGVVSNSSNLLINVINYINNE